MFESSTGRESSERLGPGETKTSVVALKPVEALVAVRSADVIREVIPAAAAIYTPSAASAIC